MSLNPSPVQGLSIPTASLVGTLGDWDSLGLALGLGLDNDGGLTASCNGNRISPKLYR